MVKPPYLETLRELTLATLDLARIEAIAVLPDELREEHARLQKSREFVDAWAETEEQYLRRNLQPDFSILHALSTLSVITTCQAKIERLQIEYSAQAKMAERLAQGLPPVDLSLGKRRGA